MRGATDIHTDFDGVPDLRLYCHADAHGHQHAHHHTHADCDADLHPVAHQPLLHADANVRTGHTRLCD